LTSIGRIFARSAALLCALLTSAGAIGADPAPAATPTAAPAAPLTDDVGEWSKQAHQRLFEIKERLSGPSEVAAAQVQLTALEARFDSSIAQFIAHPDSTNTLTEAALRDAQREIGSIAAAADTISTSLTQRGASLEALTRELTATQKRAAAIKSAATDTPLPEAFRTRLDAIVTDASALLAGAQQRLDHVGALQNEILVLDERIRTARDDLNQAETKRVQALFELQQPPLWRVGAAEISASIGGSSRFVGQALPGAWQFVSDHPARIVLHLSMFFIGFAVVMYLRRTFDSAAVGAPVSRATTRPISASMLVMLLLAPFVYPDAPTSVIQILGIVSLVPLLRILTLYLEPRMHPIVFGLAAVFLLERLTMAFARDVVLQRMVLLILSTATIALFMWARSLKVGANLGLGRRVAVVVRQLALAGIGLSVASLLFNVIGNVDLAMLLQSTTVRSATVAAGLHAAVLVIDELARLVVHSMKARGVRSVTNYETTILRRTHTTVTVVAFVGWTVIFLVSIRVMEPFAAIVGDALNATWTIGQVTISLGRVLGFIVAVWSAVQASRITQVLLHDDVLPRFALPRGVPNAISTVANYVMVLIGLVIGASVLGVELSNLTLIISALGVGIGFGLQNVVNNLVSGFILIFERSVQIGDTVQIAELQGRVTQIGLRASRLRTFNGSEVIVPNGELISNKLINWTLSDRRRRLEVTVGVAYGSNQDQVHSILTGVLAAEPEVLRDPEPLVVFEAFGDSALNFRLLFWIPDLDVGLKTTDRVNTAIARAFDEAGIEIPYPQRDIHIRTQPG
jgi:potassium-dependent mechanosensitive channel